MVPRGRKERRHIMKMIRKKALLLLLAVIFAVSASACGASDKDDSAQAAQIGDKIITENQLEKFSMLYLYSTGYDPSDLTEDQKKVILDLLVDAEVISRYYKDNDTDIYNDDYDSGKKQFVENAKNGESDFLTQNDITDDDLVYFYRVQYLNNQLFTEIEAEHPDEDTAAAAEAYYEEHREDFAVEKEKRLSIILTETKEEAEDIRTSLEEGAEFASLAQEQSIDENSSSAGGDVGFFTESQMEARYGEGLFDLNTGDVSEPVKTSDGYVIATVTDVNDTGYQSYEEVAQEIYYIIYEQYYDEKLADLRNELVITISETYSSDGE